MGYGPSSQQRGGGNYGEKLVNFKLSDAERIANVVSLVEGARRDRNGSVLPRAAVSGGGVTFRIATFTGPWPIGSDKDVRLVQETATTVTASNLFFPITEPGSGGQINCGIAKDGTAWYLIDVPLATATAVFVRQTAAVSFVSGATVTTTSITYVTNVTATFNTSNCTVTVQTGTATASQSSLTTQTATASVVVNSYTATFFRIGV